jgi:hypothetical protein
MKNYKIDRNQPPQSTPTYRDLLLLHVNVNLLDTWRTKKKTEIFINCFLFFVFFLHQKYFVSALLRIPLINECEITRTKCQKITALSSLNLDTRNPKRRHLQEGINI